MVQDYIYDSLNDGEVSEGESCIFDAKDLSIWHLWKLASGVSTLRNFLKYVQEAVPHRLVENHYVNCSPVLTKVIALIRPFMKKELNDSMHFHTEGLESLYNFIPRNELPKTYGGELESLEVTYEEFCKVMHDNSDHFRDISKWGLKIKN
jgi:hypothetical protein